MINAFEALTDQLVKSIKSEFESANKETWSTVSLETEIINQTLWIRFSDVKVSKCLSIPLPIADEKGLRVIENNDVTRVVCHYWLEQEQKPLNYHEILEILLCGDISRVRPDLTSEETMIHKIVKSFDKSYQIDYMVRRVQTLLNELLWAMPLHETDMNTWAMNHRIMIIDPEFTAIQDPDKRLEYQVAKSKKYYEKYGWTPIGLSDQVLADKNYILNIDLRNHTPFGAFHNPQRNLYSTLCMKGDELPRIRTKTMQSLMEKGVTRKGWNLTTAVLDTPLNFEDQILVSNKFRGLSSTTKRKYTVYGNKVLVNVKDKVKTGQTIGFSDSGEPVKMRLKCDEAEVIKIKKDVSEIGGDPVVITVVTVEGRRYLKDGTKFSNLHGNKGIIRFQDLGYAVDPRNGGTIEIDVMISAESINKRKNFGQILEALTNNLWEGSDPIVIEDDYTIETKNIGRALLKAGFPEDGSFMMDTPWGEFEGVVGKMFWGVTKDPEDQLWEDDRTEIVNNKELRISGLKMSHVELKALVTRFGPRNPLLKEILSCSQGAEILQDEIRILKSAKGELPTGYPIVDAVSVKTLDIQKGIFFSPSEISGSVVDEEFIPEGFILRLPFYVQAVVSKDYPHEYVMNFPQQQVDDIENVDTYVFNQIFIPNSLLRRCWKHPSGKWGLSPVGGLINRLISIANQFTHTGSLSSEMALLRIVSDYFKFIANRMGSKAGDLSTYGMAVRYPYSSRATAALSEDLPENTVELHRDMANTLKVKTGDIILIERFPCLGFMSIRPQYVRVTDDPQCKYVIRVSGNSLVSMGLDFDGDTIYPASFHTPESKELLRKEMQNPNPECEAAIIQMNNKKVPKFKEMTLPDFEIRPFPKPNNEEHAELVRKATGVKSHTGPVIALAYNLMRIVESNVSYRNRAEHVHLELLLDFLGNTVFKQKHGIKSLQKEATDAICTADLDKMVQLGFDRAPSKLLCDLIKKEAASIGIRDLVYYHGRIQKSGGSKIINLIVRRKNKIYFATRAMLGPFNLLNHLDNKPVDLPSYMLVRTLRAETEDIEKKLLRLRREKNPLECLKTEKMKDVYRILSNYIDGITTKNNKYKEANNGL